MTSALATASDAVPVAQIPFAIASRPMRRFSNQQTVSNLNATSFAPIPLPATGMVRKIGLLFTFTGTCASAGAVVAGDGPWNLISGITLTDATGQPIFQPISGYNLYLINKYLPTGIENPQFRMLPFNNPHLGPDFAFSATATAFSASFRLDLELEIDPRTGYGCVPNLDANASLQLKIDAAPYSVAFSGTTVSAASLSVTVEQSYWAPVQGGPGVSLETLPPGFGDFTEWRYETQVANAASENTSALSAKGGLIKGIILVSRAAGVRTALTAGSNVGLVFDNTAIDEGVRLESHLDYMRRSSGHFGAELATSYAPLTAGVLAGLDRGVIVWNFDSLSEGRESWLNTKPGTQLQVKFTPGASATQVEFITGLGQIRFADEFYRR